MKEEIARERENVEKRYRSELDALETQKQKESESHSEVKKQLTEEAEKIDAKHEKLMTELENKMVGIRRSLSFKNRTGSLA